MQDEIEALKKNLELKYLEKRNGEWSNLKSTNLVPVERVKLVCGDWMVTTSGSLGTKVFTWRFRTELGPDLMLDWCPEKMEGAVVSADWRGAGRRVIRVNAYCTDEELRINWPSVDGTNLVRDHLHRA